jgi:hypothetical protein
VKFWDVLNTFHFHGCFPRHLLILVSLLHKISSKILYSYKPNINFNLVTLYKFCITCFFLILIFLVKNITAACSFINRLFSFANLLHLLTPPHCLSPKQRSATLATEGSKITFTFHLSNKSSNMKSIIFWDITPYSLVQVHWCFGGFYYLHLPRSNGKPNKQAASTVSVCCLLGLLWHWKWRQYVSLKFW